MSRGPGRIERTIRALMAANPDLAFTTDWLCCQLFATSQVEKKHRISVLRAIHRIIAANPDWSIMRRHCCVLFNQADLQSYATACFIAHGFHPWVRRPWRWKDDPDQWPLEAIREKARAMIAKRSDVVERVREDWERHCAERRGDHARVAEIDMQRELRCNALQAQLTAYAR